MDSSREGGGRRRKAESADRTVSGQLYQPGEGTGGGSLPPAPHTEEEAGRATVSDQLRPEQSNSSQGQARKLAAYRTAQITGTRMEYPQSHV